MLISGCIQNGVVILQDGVTLPEGAAVTVVYCSPTMTATDGRPQGRIEFPLVRSARPGSIDLTNDRIAELLDDQAASP